MSDRMVDDKIKWHEMQIKLAHDRIKYHQDKILILKGYNYEINEVRL